MEKIVKPEELAKGMHITVYKWFYGNDGSFKGDVMEVKAVDLPFVVVKVHTGYSMPYRRMVLDTRLCEFMRLSKEFVEAAMDHRDDLMTTIFKSIQPEKLELSKEKNAKR